MIKFQCKNCLYLMGLPDALKGRKILCPLCGLALVIPEPDPKRRFKKQVLRDNIEKFRITDWDMAFAKVVLGDSKTDDKKLLKAIITFLKTSKKTSNITLAQVLVTDGIISPDERKAYQLKLRGSVEEDTDLAECPNCFAHIKTNTVSCKYCGQNLGENVRSAICPNCKTEQPKEIPRCRRCLADMKTGLRPTKQRCAKCSELIIGNPEFCPKCKNSLRKPKTSSRRGGMSTRTKLSMAVAVAAALLMMSLLVYPTLKLTVRKISVGSSQALLEQRSQLFAEALQENSLDKIEDFLAEDCTLQIDDKARTLILAGSEFQGRIRKVKNFKILNAKIKSAKKAKPQETLQATVEIEAKALWEPEKADNALYKSRRAFAARKKNFRIIWHWCRKGKAKWFFLRVGNKD